MSSRRPEPARLFDRDGQELLPAACGSGESISILKKDVTGPGYHEVLVIALADLPRLINRLRRAGRLARRQNRKVSGTTLRVTKLDRTRKGRQA